MSFLKKMFTGDGVSDADYNAREADDMQEPVLSRRVTDTARVSATARTDNVVEFSRARMGVSETSSETTGAFPREPSYTREASGYTREFEPSAPSGGGFSAGGTGRLHFGGDTAEAYVVFKRLKDFTMASAVADKMVERKIVILNLESCDDEVARRVLDFIGGVAYACSSMVKRIAGRVFMITPKGISSDGEFFDENHNNDPVIRYDD
jgi:hypothetical protein